MPNVDEPRERRNGFFMAAKAIMDDNDPRITKLTLVVYMAVCFFANMNERRHCFASVEAIAQRARVCERTARDELVTLVETGHISLVGRASSGRRANTYLVPVNRFHDGDDVYGRPMSEHRRIS